MADNIDINKIVKNSFDNKVSQGNLSKPPFEAIYDKYKNRDLKTEASFLNKARINIPYMYFNSNKKAILVMSLCFMMLFVTLYEPTRAFAGQLLKKIYVVYESNGDFKLKQIEIADEPQSQIPIKVPDVTSFNDTEISERLGYKVVIPSELPGDYLLVSKTISQAGDNDKELKDFVKAWYAKQNVDGSKEDEFICLNVTDLKWPLYGTQFIVNGIEYYYKESGVAEYQTSYDEQGNMIFDQEKKPKGIDLVHRLSWRIDKVTYSIGDVSGRDLSKEQLLEIAKPLVDKLKSK